MNHMTANQVRKSLQRARISDLEYYVDSGSMVTVRSFDADGDLDFERTEQVKDAVMHVLNWPRAQRTAWGSWIVRRDAGRSVNR